MDSEWDALSENLASQARELWSHLPPGEVADDEEIHFRTDDAGNLMVHVPANGNNYRLRRGLAWRARVLSTGELEVGCWQYGELCELRILRADHMEAKWN